MAKNNFSKTVNVILKQAHATATRCVLAWAALALREEGFGSKRIRRVLENIHKYACTLNGKSTIDEQLKHIENVTGLRIVWTDSDEIRIDEIEDWPDEED